MAGPVRMSAKPSKSATKREQEALQQLGEQLIAWNGAELEQLPLDDALRTAIQDAARMTARGALRRQKQLIGKLMRGIDPAPIRAAVAARDAQDRARKRAFAAAEHWRDRIVRDGRAAIDAFGKETGAQVPQLADLCSELGRAGSDSREKNLRRRLFRCIHDALLTASRDDRLSQ